MFYDTCDRSWDEILRYCVIRLHYCDSASLIPWPHIGFIQPLISSATLSIHDSSLPWTIAISPPLMLIYIWPWLWLRRHFSLTKSLFKIWQIRPPHLDITTPLTLTLPHPWPWLYHSFDLWPYHTFDLDLTTPSTFTTSLTFDNTTPLTLTLPHLWSLTLPTFDLWPFTDTSRKVSR